MSDMHRCQKKTRKQNLLENLAVLTVEGMTLLCPTLSVLHNTEP